MKVLTSLAGVLDELCHVPVIENAVDIAAQSRPMSRLVFTDAVAMENTALPPCKVVRGLYSTSTKHHLQVGP